MQSVQEHIDLSYEHPIIYYDAQCLLCDGFIKSLIRQDSAAKFKFCSLQDEQSREIRDMHAMSDEISTVLLLKEGKWYFKSDVTIQIAQSMSGLWIFVRTIKIVPRFIRDAVYDIIAKHRYRWFGKSESCIIPTQEISARFI